jgi:hypothetical protein
VVAAIMSTQYNLQGDKIHITKPITSGLAIPEAYRRARGAMLPRLEGCHNESSSIHTSPYWISLGRVTVSHLHLELFDAY